MSIEVILSTVGVAAAAMTLPGSLELGLLTAGSFLPGRRNSKTSIGPLPRLAVVIPAHNEHDAIGSCLASLAQCRRINELAEVFVVADNCTDDTAALARAAGLQVLERTNHQLRGKGYALHFAFEQLLKKDFDGFLIIDADAEVAAGLIEEFANGFARGAKAMQCPYLVANPEQSRLLGLALRAFNAVRPRGRARLGLSAGILGNGFALSRAVLQTVPYTADSIVEDLEYHINLVQAGVRVEYLESTWVKATMPVGGAGQASQRARWEGGRVAILRERGGWLFSRVLRSEWRFAEVLMDLLTLPLAFHVLLLLTALLLPSTFGRTAAVAGLLIVAVHILAAVQDGDSVSDDLRTLAKAPLYVLWKLNQIPRILKSSSRSTPWIRTARAAKELPNG
jgi:cellulose synthase/poly-beta-1,6-N-acetylglucosamine synthase-like glycosyltransferase